MDFFLRLKLSILTPYHLIIDYVLSTSTVTSRDLQVGFVLHSRPRLKALESSKIHMNSIRANLRKLLNPIQKQPKSTKCELQIGGVVSLITDRGETIIEVERSIFV